jgi:hypothetical protein
LPPPLVFVAAVAPSFGVGIGALIAVRQATSFPWSSFAFPGCDAARFYSSPMSSRRL